MFARIVLWALAVLAVVAGVATPASASEDAPSETAGVSVLPRVVEQGGTAQITVPAGSFDPGEQVIVTVVYDDDGAALGALLPPSSATEVRAADEDGGLRTSFTAPARGSGAFEVHLDGSRDYVAVVTVIESTVLVAEGVVAAPQTSATPRGTTSLVFAWIGIGAVAVGAGAMITGVLRRRRA